MNQPDLYELCHTWCKLKTCDEKSALCLFKLFTDPNAAQRELIDPLAKQQAKQDAELRKREYDARYREQHREDKRIRDRERYRKEIGGQYTYKVCRVS